jgi:hypothetical protein
MPDFYKKECPIDGPQDPVPSGHLSGTWSIPRKCDGCNFHFEGECGKITNRRVRLDYGFCGIDGPKDLVDDPRAKRRIPRKCATCPFLETIEVYGLICGKDKEMWGQRGRGLDY